MIALKLLGSVIIAWLISAMGVAALGELIENKNTQDEFILVLVCIWVYMGCHGICGYFKKRPEKTQSCCDQCPWSIEKKSQKPSEIYEPRTLEKSTIRSDSLISTESLKNRPSVIVAEQQLQKPLDRPPLFCYNDSVSQRDKEVLR